jgi:hypothetical protein
MAAVISFRLWALGVVERAASASSIAAFQMATDSGGAASVNELKDKGASTTFSTARRCLLITDFTASIQFLHLIQ